MIRDNRELAERRDLSDISFRVGSPPDLEMGQAFDIVYCMPTLYFVEEVERAIETLYSHVDAGGYLVFNYPTEATREWLRDESRRKREFFSPVVSGTTLLTREALERLLDADLHDYWAFVGATELQSPENPAVFVRR